MEDKYNDKSASPEPTRHDVHSIVQKAIQEYARQEQARKEPAYKAELQDERRRREQLEGRLNELIEENKKARHLADEAERGSTIRSELQRLGVAKVDLAYKAVQQDVVRAEDGRLVAKADGGDMGIKEYLANFVNENPEFLPARISGGSGLTGTQKAAPANSGGIDLERIKPGMSREEMDRARQEIARVASKTLREL